MADDPNANPAAASFFATVDSTVAYLTPPSLDHFADMTISGQLGGSLGGTTDPAPVPVPPMLPWALLGLDAEMWAKIAIVAILVIGVTALLQKDR